MRGHPFIDYKQLNLDFKLQRSDLLYNMVSLYYILKNEQQALNLLNDKVMEKVPEKTTLLKMIQNKVTLFSLKFPN